MSVSPPPHIACSVCAGLDDLIEIENAQEPSDTDIVEGFPEGVGQLRVPNDDLERTYRYKNERLLKCDECGTYYSYRTWAPGGSEDVLRTYIHESVRRLSFLEAYLELDDARYQASERAREYGSVYEVEHQAAEVGVQAEMALLRSRYRELAWDAVQWLEHKYRRSEQVGETLRLYSPHLDHTRQIAEARARDEGAARYYAGVLVEQFQYWGAAEIPASLLRQVVGLLADDDAAVRGMIVDALLGLLQPGSGCGGRAQVIADAAQQLAPRTAEAEALLRACGTQDAER